MQNRTGIGKTWHEWHRIVKEKMGSAQKVSMRFLSLLILEISSAGIDIFIFTLYEQAHL